MYCKKCKKEIPDNSTFCNHCGIKQLPAARKRLKRANGTGSVYEKKDHRKRPWAAVVTRYTDNIRNNILIGYFQTKTEALNALATANAEAIPDRFNATLRDVYDAWSTEHFPTLSKSGVAAYEAAWNYLKRHHGVKMRDIRTQHLQTAVDYVIEQNKGRATCEKVKQLCSQLCKYAMRDDIINKNYAQFVQLPKSEAKEKQIFSMDEIVQLMYVASNASASEDCQTARIILTLIYSGLRINELFSMQREDVFTDKRYMVGGEKTDAGRDRIIPIHRNILPYIEQWYNHGGRFLLCNTKGNKLDAKNFRDRRFYPLLERLNIIDQVQKGIKPRLTPHCTRHTFISMMVEKNAKAELLKDIVGHSKYETTVDCYTHTIDVTSLVQQVDKLE